MDNGKKRILGEQWVTEWLKGNGYVNVRCAHRVQNGCDILADKDGTTYKIEVKTTGNLEGGIPDMHDTEFTRQDGGWYFNADFLYVLRLNSDDVPVQLDILTKEEVDSFAADHKTVTRVRTHKLDTELKNKRIGKSITL